MLHLDVMLVIWLFTSPINIPQQEATNLQFMYQAFEAMGYVVLHSTFGSEDPSSHCCVDIIAFSSHSLWVPSPRHPADCLNPMDCTHAVDPFVFSSHGQAGRWVGLVVISGVLRRTLWRFWGPCSVPNKSAWG